MHTEVGTDGLTRCRWGTQPDIYRAYHDNEWGWPVADDRRLFEKLCLESFQSGLSWLTVLKKRDNLRAVFNDFDPGAVAAMKAVDVERLLADPGIIRHRGKIESAINNARKTVKLQETQSLASYVWSFEPAGPSPQLAITSESDALARALKQLGFTWLGPTTVYAFMQAMGLVNDHLPGCYLAVRIDIARAGFERP